MKSVTVACLFLLACSSSPKTPLPVCGADPPQADLIALTFNAGLGPGLDVPYAHGRLQPVIQAVTAAPWDVLCLDETWTDEDHDAIIGALGLPADHVYSVDTRGMNEDPLDRCDPGALDDGLACMRANCSGVPDEDVTNCALDHCQAEGIVLYANHRHCFNCVIATAGLSIDGIKATCEGVGASQLFDGRNGVILASKFPLRDTEWIALPSSYANRVGLFAAIDVKGTTVQVACTHVTASRDIITPTDPRFPTWDDEMNFQMGLLAGRLASRASDGPQLLLGDMNTGPNWADGSVDDGPVWDGIGTLGFESPAAETDPHLCSRCKGSVIAPTDGATLIDHVLTRGDAKLAPVCAAQAMDAPVTFTDPSAGQVTTNLSDHYGITVRFEAR